MRRHSIWAVTAVLATTLLGGCGGAEKPAVCDSLDAVRASVDHVRDANVSENGMSQLRTDLTRLKTDLNQLANDAKAQFKPEVDKVRSAADELSSAVKSAKADPTSTTFASVRTAVEGLGDAVRNMDTALSDTC